MELGERSLLVQHVKQRRVVFVDDDGHLSVRFFVGAADKAHELFARSLLAGISAEFCLQWFEQQCHITCRGFAFGNAKVDMEFVLLMKYSLADFTTGFWGSALLEMALQAVLDRLTDFTCCQLALFSRAIFSISSVCSFWSRHFCCCRTADTLSMAVLSSKYRRRDACVPW